MPFYLKNHNQQCYISELFIIVSGKYTLNAKEKIRNKLCKTIFGNVHFLDKEDIQNLMTKYWKK